MRHDDPRVEHEARDAAAGDERRKQRAHDHRKREADDRDDDGPLGVVPEAVAYLPASLCHHGR